MGTDHLVALVEACRVLWCRVGDTTNFRQLSGRTLPSERHPDPVEAAIRLAIRNIRFQPPKGTVQDR